MAPVLFHTTTFKEPILIQDYKRNFEFYHEDRCCERVYVDLDHEPTYLKQLSNDSYSFDKLEYRTCPGDGFMVKVFRDYSYLGHIYYPCYNKQNGYYSDNLTLTIDGHEYRLNMMGCIHDIIH